MDYTLESADRIAETLRAIPAKDPSKRRLDKQGMVRHVAPEIVALQERGYTLEEIAESLRGCGLDITTPTLKNYLQRAKGAGGKSRKARRPSGQPRADAKVVPERAPPEPGPNPPPVASKAETPTTPAPDPTLRSGKGAFLIKDKESY